MNTCGEYMYNFVHVDAFERENNLKTLFDENDNPQN